MTAVATGPRVIDLFAGLGGFSEGARLAGAEVLWAANHWRDAVDTHALNHPGAQHVCQDLHQADWTQVPAHDILLASPSCTGHTHARGKERSTHDAARATAWAVVSALETHRTPVAVVENVPEFQDWELFPAWELALRRLGYALAPHLIDAADHGVPQHRLRLFIVATRSEAPLRLKLTPQKTQPIGPHLSFDNRYVWSPVARHVRATRERVVRGRAQHGARFVMPYYGSGSGLTGRGLDRPLGTVTTRDRWALVDGDRMRMLQPPEYRAAMGFRSAYRLPSVRKTAIFMLGNAVCPPVARDIITALQAAA